MQQVSPTAPLDRFASTLFALSRLPVGLWSIVTLSEIDRLHRKSTQATLDALVRSMGTPKTEIWHHIVEAESFGLLRSRLVHRHHLSYQPTKAGRAVLGEAQHLLAMIEQGTFHGEGVFSLNRGGAQIEQGEPPTSEAQNTTAPASAGTAPSPGETPAPPVARSRVRPPATAH